jgi:hypothetical protein
MQLFLVQSSQAWVCLPRLGGGGGWLGVGSAGVCVPGGDATCQPANGEREAVRLYLAMLGWYMAILPPLQYKIWNLKISPLLTAFLYTFLWPIFFPIILRETFPWRGGTLWTPRHPRFHVISEGHIFQPHFKTLTAARYCHGTSESCNLSFHLAAGKYLEIWRLHCFHCTTLALFKINFAFCALPMPFNWREESMNAREAEPPCTPTIVGLGSRAATHSLQWWGLPGRSGWRNWYEQCIAITIEPGSQTGTQRLALWGVVERIFL